MNFLAPELLLGLLLIPVAIGAGLLLLLIGAGASALWFGRLP